MLFDEFFGKYDNVLNDVINDYWKIVIFFLEINKMNLKATLVVILKLILHLMNIKCIINYTILHLVGFYISNLNQYMMLLRLKYFKMLSRDTKK